MNAEFQRIARRDKKAFLSDQCKEIEENNKMGNTSDLERLLLNNKSPGFLASRGDEFNPGPEMRLDRSELLCNKMLLKYTGDRESFWHKHQKGAKEYPPPSL